MNVLISYGIYMILTGNLAILSTIVAKAFGWIHSSSFLNTYNGIGAGMIVIGLLGLVCGVFLGAVANDSHPKKVPFMYFLLSLFGASVSIVLALCSLYLQTPTIDCSELITTLLQFLSIFGLFASPLGLIEGYLKEIQKGREECSDEANI